MSEPKRIQYRGVSMVEGWPEKIAEAQKQPTLTRADESTERVRFGDEQDDWGANEHPCADCGVIKGEFHVLGCDGEECPACHEQLLSCDCGFDELNEP